MPSNFNLLDCCSQYKTYHLDRTNIKIHFICVPIIQWAVMSFLSMVEFKIAGYNLDLEMAIFAITAVYWTVLNWQLAIGMMCLSVPFHFHTQEFKHHPNAVSITAAIFVVAWIGQFIGHYVFEKAKPAFFDDITQLFVGPIFLMSEAYYICGWRPDLEEEILKRGIDNRRAMEDAKHTKK